MRKILLLLALFIFAPIKVWAAQPDISAAVSIFGECVATSLADTSATVIVNNAASSDDVYRVTRIMVANDDGTNSADITLALHPQDDGGGTGVQFASTIAVPADSTLIVINGSPVYVQEDESIVATASAGGDLNVIACYEEITD